MTRWGNAGARDGVPWEWWGPFGARGTPIGLIDLVAGGVVTPAETAWLWTHVERGGSLCVCAGPSGAGKTTLLTGLADALPSGTERVYLRGMYETFAFRRQTKPGAAAIMVNEISPHLPIYCWGDAARGLLQCGRDGYQILATAHATSPEEMVHSLAARPLRLPPELIAQLSVLAFLEVAQAPDGRIVRRLRSIVRLDHAADRGAIVTTPIEPQAEAERDPEVWQRSKAIAGMSAATERPSPSQTASILRATQMGNRTVQSESG